LDAITSDRPYRKGKCFENAIREIEKCGGAQFDPLIVDAFLSVPPKIWQRVKQAAKNSLRLPSIH
jgi:HD-GYP domain-containing protein (c-di-GMP phosphodiesterase class II)